MKADLKRLGAPGAFLYLARLLWPAEAGANLFRSIIAVSYVGMEYMYVTVESERQGRGRCVVREDEGICIASFAGSWCKPQRQLRRKSRAAKGYKVVLNHPKSL